MSQPAETCTHERRPGTTVCLRCRHAARTQARERMQRLLLRGAAFTIVIAIFVTAGTLTASALHNRGAAKDSVTVAKPRDSVASAAPTAPTDSAPTRDTTQTAIHPTLAGQPAAPAAPE